MKPPENSETAPDSADLAKMFLQASSVSGRPDIYFVGPFGRRVSFASQQRRALNTVWAVGRTGKLAQNPTVAVVGAGLAGVTTCAALIAAQCNVTLIERSDSVLERQDVTTHRYVHPTINFWPEQELNPTTEFPYLDWFEDKCSDVVALIRKEWTEVFRKGLSEFLPRTCATALKSIPGEKPKLEIARNFGRTDEVTEERSYDLVFVTTGFGEETTLQPSEPSYWRVDGLEAHREAGTKNFVVAGTGDGGMIDALRLVQSTFDGGRICLRIIRQLDAQGVSSRVKAIEEQVWAASGHDDLQAAKLYHDRYAELLEVLNIQVREELAKRHSDIQVTLVGHLPHPYGLHVAPIHKLMMASALAAGSIQYLQGRLVRDGNWYQINDCPPGSAPPLVPRDAKVIVRIGPSSPLTGLLYGEEVRMLRESQQKLADFLRPAPLDTAFFRGYGKLPARNVEDIGFVRFRKALMEDYLYKHHRVLCQISAKKGRPKVTLLIPSGTQVEDGRLPSKLFGIELERRSMSVGRGL